MLLVPVPATIGLKVHGIPLCRSNFFARFSLGSEEVTNSDQAGAIEFPLFAVFDPWYPITFEIIHLLISEVRAKNVQQIEALLRKSFTYIGGYHKHNVHRIHVIELAEFLQ